MAAAASSRGATTPAISEQPLVAVALVGEDLTVERATALFLDCSGAPEPLLDACRAQIESVLAGEVDATTARLDRTTLEIAAVLDGHGVRCALLTIVRPADDVPGDAAAPLLSDAIDGSPAIAWLKDMGRRYLRVNHTYVTELKTAAEKVCGRTDDELAPGESVEGLRLRDGHDPRREPLEFEYTVDTGDERPAFAVLRFALRDADGNPTAVCGVAAPLPRAHLARTECARLMRLAGWSRSDEPALRAELIDEWGLTPADESGEQLAVPARAPESEPSAGEGDADQFVAMAAELDAALATAARLDQELAEERRQVMVLREASVLSARRAQDMFRTVTAERSRSADLEESLARAEAQVGELERERDAAQTRAERAEAAASDAPTQEQLEAERGQAHEAKLAAEQAQAEVASTAAALAKERRTVETLRSELRVAEEEVGRARRAASEALAQAPTHDELEQERRRADRATAGLASARARAELAEAEAKSALAQARAELRRTHEEAAEMASALHTEKQSVVSLRAQLAELRDEVEGARQALTERPDAEQLQHERSRAVQAEAAAEQARRETSDLAERIAELEQAAVEAAESSGALSAEQRTVKRLRDELSGLRAELKAAKRAAAERPEPVTELEELEQARAEADEANAALSEQTKRAEQATAAAEKAKKKALSATAAAQAEREAAEALRVELSAAQAELERWQAGGAVPADEPTPIPESAPGSPAWNATAQRTFSEALAPITEWRNGLKQVVKIIGAQGSWDAAVIWSLEQRRAFLKCVAMWSGDAIGSSTFETRVWQHRHKPPTGAEANSASVLAPLDGAQDAVLKAAAAEGMSSTVRVPISDGTQLIGLLQLFTSCPEPPSAELMASLEGIGLQLGTTARLLESAGTPQWRLGRL